MVGPDLYVGGYKLGAVSDTGDDYIARWDGTAWHALGDGVNFIVEAISAAGTDIYIGGLFTDAGGNACADYIARWDTTIHQVFLPLAVRK